MICTDEKKLVERAPAAKDSNAVMCFMDHRKETVQALRDAAGLSWGAVDFGGETSGDIMHLERPG